MLEILARGFEHPVAQSQAAFRAAMQALANPGQCIAHRAELDAQAPLSGNAAALGLALLDFEVKFHLAPSLAKGASGDYFRFHTGSTQVQKPDAAAFAFVDLASDGLRLADYAQGMPEYPDRSTTIIALCNGADESAALRLTGPGIEAVARLAVAPLPADFPAQWAANRAGFPLGVDILFVTAEGFIGLPRSTRILAGDA